MLVELAFTHDGERYMASRSLAGTKQSDGCVPLRNEDGFAMTRTRHDGEAERVHNPLGTMNAILPGNVRTYFLFDGEKIDNFARPDAGDEVRYAKYNVLKLEVLERGRRHLQDAAAEYRRELKNISTGEVPDLIEHEEKPVPRENENRRAKVSWSVRSKPPGATWPTSTSYSGRPKTPGHCNRDATNSKATSNNAGPRRRPWSRISGSSRRAVSRSSPGRS